MADITNFFKKLEENPRASFELTRERVRKPVDRLQIAPSPQPKPKADADEKGSSKSNKSKSKKKFSTNADVDETPRPGDRSFEKHEPSPFKEGDVVWAKWGKNYLPARIAKETEPNPAIFRSKKPGLVLMFWFETKDYSYVPKTSIAPWKDEYDKRITSKTSKIFLDAINAAQKWQKSPGPYPEYESESEDEEILDGEESSDESSSSSSSDKKSKGSPKKVKAEEKSPSPKKRKREEEEEDDEKERPPEKRQRQYGLEDEPKGVRKLRVMRELGLVPPEGSPWARKKSA